MYTKTRALIEAFRQEGIYSGVAYQFISPEETAVYFSGFAQTDPQKVIMQEDLLFDVASLTKVVCTTTVVLKLWEARKLMMDDLLHTHLPEFHNQTITLRHLLTHTSDIQTYIPNRDQLSQAELRAAYYQLEPGTELGSRVQYTDAGTILLGFMLEKIYQKPVIQIFQEEVLNPLEMTQSCFLPETPERIVPTEKIPGVGVLKGITHDPKARVLAEHAGNAGLFTNLEDLAKFTQMLLDCGQVNGKTFLQSQTIEALLRDQTIQQTGQRSLGWDLKFDLYDQHPLLFHTGYTGTFLLVDIMKGSAFIFLSNRVHPNDDRELYIEKRDEILMNYLKEKVLS